MSTRLNSLQSLGIAVLTAALGTVVLLEQPLLAQIVQIYDNGSLATGTVSESGVVAPAGTQWSEAAHDAGSLLVANTIGVPCWRGGFGGFPVDYRCADDFNVPVGQTWTLSSVITYQFQTDFAGATSPINHASLQILRGRPGDSGTIGVFGDEFTNRLSSSVDASMWRVPSTVAGGAPSPPVTNRRVWATTITVSPALVLPAGNYWISWNTNAGFQEDHFTPTVTYPGTRTLPIQNARHLTRAIPSVWTDLVDEGQVPPGQPAPARVRMDFPFKLMGTITNAPLAPASRTMDFDGDNKSDFAIARASSAVGAATWWIQHAAGPISGINWGVGVGFAGGDIATPADFDGDGKTDIAVWRPGSPGMFWVLQSSNGQVRAQPWGSVGDDPTVVGDYDGDGRADCAIFRPGTLPNEQSQWWILRSSDSSVMALSWGLTGDKPYPGDYDGDRRMDVAVIRNQAGQALHFQNRSGGAVEVIYFGLFADRFALGDFDADGRHDLTAIRNSGGSHVWYVSKSSDGLLASFNWGSATVDFLTPGDFDGDNRTDAAVWRSGQPANLTNFHLWNSRSSPGRTLWGLSAGALTPPDLPLGSFNVR